jgi:hypothetical protein
MSKFVWGASYLPWFWLAHVDPSNGVIDKAHPTYDAEGNITSIGALAERTLDLILAHPEKSPETEPTEHSGKLPLSSRQ